MTDKTPSDAVDYAATLFLPQTDFPMRAGLPKKEPELLERWANLGLYQRLREEGRGRPRFVLHDGPPYANGNIHIGHALNNTLQDVLTRFHRMRGKAALWLPGTDHAGIATQMVVERQLAAAGNIGRRDMGREAFVDKVAAAAERFGSRLAWVGYGPAHQQVFDHATELSPVAALAAPGSRPKRSAP